LIRLRLSFNLSESSRVIAQSVLLAILMEREKKKNSLSRTFFRWRAVIPRCLIYATYLCSALARIRNDRIKGRGRRDRCLLRYCSMIYVRSYYRAKIPAKVVSVCTSKNRHRREERMQGEKGGGGWRAKRDSRGDENEPRGSEPENGLVE